VTVPDEILTVPEAAELLKVCDRTVYTWTHMEGFPAMKLGNTIRIPRALLLDWVARRATQKKGV